MRPTRLASYLSLGLILSAAVACSKEPAPQVTPTAEVNEREGDPLGSVNPSEDWSWWRGPSFDGRAADNANPPTAWDAQDKQNIVWQVNPPGEGHASPVVFGKQVFIATADDDAETQSLICYDADTGKRQWATVVHTGDLPSKHSKNTHASATPACDGQQVYTAFVIDDALHVSALDLSGKIVWQRRVGDFDSQHGFGASPVLWKSTVIITADHGGYGYVAALDRKTGEYAWHTPRDGAASYGTPIIANVAGKPQLLHAGGGRVTSYDPDTGALLWATDGPSRTTGCTMAAGGGLAYATGGYPNKRLMAIDAGSGDVEWDTETRKRVTYVPSPLLHDGRLYVVNDDGHATCFDAESGEVIWEEKIARAVSSSPILAGGHIYVGDERGTTYVFKPGDRFDLVAENELYGGIFASPTFVGDRVYIRTDSTLYCIQRSKS